jgi:hypothetical protein
VLELFASAQKPWACSPFAEARMIDLLSSESPRDVIFPTKLRPRVNEAVTQGLLRRSNPQSKGLGT